MESNLKIMRMISISSMILLALFLVACGGGGDGGDGTTTPTTSGLDFSSPESTLESLSELESWDRSGDYDSDGLTNGFEIDILGLVTRPDLFDTDDDGLSDAEEDSDSDGLTNLQEQEYSTNPLFADTDNDGVNDGDEILANTNPLSDDTDVDGLKDGDELIVGTDPLNPDTDGDTILDGDEVFTTTASDSSGLEVLVTGVGNVADNITISQNDPSAATNNIPGLTSSVINLHSATTFEQAEIQIPITADMRAAVASLQDLTIVLIDFDTKELIIPSDQGISSDETYLWATVDHFSNFTVIDRSQLSEEFSEEFYGSTRVGSGELDVALVIDSSGSMSWNDPSGLRKDAAKDLIDGLTSGDKVAVIDFDGSATLLISLGSNFALAKSMVDQIDSSGGTDLGAGISMAIDHINDVSTSFSPLIIMLTDGEGSYDESLTTLAKDSSIRIYTIGLGDSVDENLLEEIATGTDGRYFQVASADDLVVVFETLRQETEDSDGDGLPDYSETNGMRTWLGVTIFTDPNNPDTDGDGLMDGDEMYAVRDASNGMQYDMVSNPTVMDSDGDSLDDGDENLSGTNPLDDDTDKDNLKDGIDSYPLEWDWYGSFRKGDIILLGHDDEYVEADNWSLAQKFAMHPWSHSVMYMGDEKTLDAHPRNKGVAWGNIHEFLYNEDYDRIAFLKVEDKDDDAATRAGEKAETYIGSNFDYGFSEWETLKESFGSDDELYCAELIYKSWKPEGVDLRRALLSIFPWIRPKDIYNDWATKISKEIDPMAHERP